ncbi:MAG: EAL domain-containing protein [Pseudomonadota bacterium]
MSTLAVKLFLAAWLLLSAAVGALAWVLGVLDIPLAAMVAGVLALLGAVITLAASQSSALRRSDEADASLKAQISQTQSQLRALGGVIEDLAGEVKALQSAFIAAPIQSDAGPIALEGEHPLALADASQGEGVQRPPRAQQIASAILSNRIDLHVQSLHHLPSRRPLFFECLSRLRNEEGEVLYPAGFLDIAARSRLITTLDNFLLLRCVQIIRQFGKRAALETFFVNVSHTSLHDPEFFEQFVDFLASNAALADHMVVEIAVPGLAELLPDIRAGLRRLKNAGYAFSLDHARLEDIGADAAALGARYIKVPAQAFLSDAAAQPVLASAKTHGLTCIATHIEDEKTLIDVIELGIEHAQGYVFGRPRPWDDVLVSKGLAQVA